MRQVILTELLKQQDGPCISVVILTKQKSFSDREIQRIKFKNMLIQVTKELEKNYDMETTEKLTNSLKSLMGDVDTNHIESGIGFYVSTSFTKLVYFPFPVQEKTIINSSFDVSDIEEALDKVIDYTVVLLSKNNTKLFKGKGNKLREIDDKNFPRHFEDEFQVHRSSPHSLYNSEESKIDDIRVESYFKEVDKTLVNYLKKDPLIVIGVTDHISKFKSVSKHTNFIIAEIKGNYDKHSLYEITQKVLPEVNKYINKEKH
jgi:hypothetical protein